MEFLRTPAHRFLNLPDYPFAPHHVQVGSPALRMHYVDEGPRNGPVVLMMHGEPSWSYLYRHMIPVCVKAGQRVIAPDLIGFGKSDKPTRITDYTYARHVAWVRDLIVQLNLRDITLVCQDWGSLIGLRLAAENEERFARIALSNGMLPTGEQHFPAAFKMWRTFARVSPWFPISGILAVGTRRTLTTRERAAYDAPFPTAKHQAGARAFPALVPSSLADPARGLQLRRRVCLPADQRADDRGAEGEVAGLVGRHQSAPGDRLPGHAGRDGVRVTGKGLQGWRL